MDIGVADGRIAAIGPTINSSVAEEFNADGLHIFPGLIDSHVHFNDPGRDEWEGIETGSRALVAGGGMMFFHIPLKLFAPSLGAAVLDSKEAVWRGKVLTEFLLMGGVLPWTYE